MNMFMSLFQMICYSLLKKNLDNSWSSFSCYGYCNGCVRKQKLRLLDYWWIYAYLDSFSVDNDDLAMSLSDASDVEIKPESQWWLYKIIIINNLRSSEMKTIIPWWMWARDSNCEARYFVLLYLGLQFNGQKIFKTLFLSEIIVLFLIK